MSVDLEFLEEIGEWAAVGFYEGIDLPFPRSFGLAMRRLYERMPVRVPDSGLIIPCESLYRARNMETHGYHHATAFICNFFHHSGLEVYPEMAEAKKDLFPHRAAEIDLLVRDLRTRLPHFAGYTHSNPDIRRVVDQGFDAIEAELDHELDGTRTSAPDDGSLPLLQALKDYATGVRAYHARTVNALCDAIATAQGPRRRQLEMVHESFAGCFLTPSRTLLSGLLAVNFAWILDGCDSIGRVDQVLGPLFDRDIESGALSIDDARQLLDEWFRAFERMNGWNLQVGGRTASGADGCNALTREIILACGRERVRRPNVAFRVTKDTPDSLLADTLVVLREGTGRPALYNDDLYISALKKMDLGLSDEDVAEIGFGGCTETMLGGLSNVGSLEGELNLAKALELALNDGIDPGTGDQAGPATGDFLNVAQFDDFLDAVKAQIRHQAKVFVEAANTGLSRRFTAGDPKLFRTLFTRDCVRNRRSFEAGGARYNWSVVSYQGIANLIDSLAAVRYCVFDAPKLTRAQLLDALASDFRGHEHALRVLRDAPKFGNDDPYVDDLGSSIMTFAWRELLSHRQVRGGRFLPSCIVFATYARAGEAIGATPDGRHASTPLNDSVGAVAGRDRKGPTALLNSVLKLPLSLAAGTPVLNLRFQKQTLHTAEELTSVLHLIRSFFARGGMQAQLSVISKADMLAAQETPDDYRDLLVRIGGYSEYFVRLDQRLQDSVIARTDYALS